MDASFPDNIVKFFRTAFGPVIQIGTSNYAIRDQVWNDLFNDQEVRNRIISDVEGTESYAGLMPEGILPPIDGQEVWAAGVTYMRSRAARVAESEPSGGSSFYDRVYDADRPELFFKTNGHRVAGHGQPVKVRSDSTWTVPEPELALAIDRAGYIWGYSIANDVSARDIEGENPLYLPQAKIYDGCCGLGPCVLVAKERITDNTEIRMRVARNDSTVFDGTTRLSSLKRTPEELVEYLYRDNSFPLGCFLLTGTGIVPPDAFSLRSGDLVSIEIDPIGTLENRVL